MNRRQTLMVLVLVLAGTLALAAGAGARPQDLPGRPVPHADVHEGAAVGAAKVVTDTTLVMGPHGSGAAFIGAFEDPAGNPDWNGWTSVDLTAAEDNPWHADDYNVPSGLYAAWCGRDYPSCEDGDLAGGYGNNLDAVLEWRGAVADPGQPCSVNVSALLNHDLEDGYDYLYLTFLEASGPVTPWHATGTADLVTLDVLHVYQPGDYTGPGGDEIVVQFVVQSDVAYSDEDCLYPSHGAVQLDDVVIDLGNGAGYAHDFEDGTLGAFVAAAPAGVGDFAQLRADLEDLDPCADNSSVQVCFIDDGLVVPGTGGSPCINWCYGPEGWIVNTTGGLLGENHHLNNAVVSPALPWLDPGDDSAFLDFDVYVHEDLSSDAPGMFTFWDVRSTAADDPAALELAPWRSMDFLYYFSGVGYRRAHRDLSTHLEPGRRWFQVRLGVVELGWIWGWTGDDGYPAPYYDNVRIVTFAQQGPHMSARGVDLAQDAFPASGALDAGDLAANSVRFDMARSIDPAANVPGDSIIIYVEPVREGAELAGPPMMHYRLSRNPVFDGVRTSGLPDVGVVACDSVRTATGEVSPGRWCVDLPDDGFLFPGDVLHYCFTASDVAGGLLRTAVLPADTTGYGDFSAPDAYQADFTVRALPTLRGPWGEAPTFAQPDLLFWNDNAGRAGQETWFQALAALDLEAGVDYDLYETNSPSSGVGNGLGGRATVAQLAGYRDIIYTCGDLPWHTLSDGGEDDLSADVQLLEAWLATGCRDLMLMGDNLASDLAQGGPESAAFLSDRLGVALVGNDVRYLIGGQVSPRVVEDTEGPRIFGMSWIAAGGCPGLNTFDAVEATGSGQRVMEFTDPGGVTAPYSYSAATLAQGADASRVLSVPCDLAFVAEDPADPWVQPAAARFLAAAGLALGFYTPPPMAVGDPPAAPAFGVRHYPNPFNPQVTIECAVARPGRMTVKIFDLRGRRVRTVFDGPVAASVALDWDGRDDGGSRAASGQYVYEVRMHGEVRFGRMTLIK